MDPAEWKRIAAAQAEVKTRLKAFGLPIEPDPDDGAVPFEFRFDGERLVGLTVAEGVRAAGPFLPRLEAFLREFPVRTLRFSPLRRSTGDNGYMSWENVVALPGIGVEGVRILAAVPAVAGLEALDLRGNGLDDAAGEILLASPLTAGPVRLFLGDLPYRESNRVSSEDKVARNSFTSAMKDRLAAAFGERIDWTSG